MFEEAHPEMPDEKTSRPSHDIPEDLDGPDDDQPEPLEPWPELPSTADVDFARVAVVIPTYNRSSSLKRCVEGVLACDVDGLCVEVHVVDDGSTDDTPTVMATLGAAYSGPVRLCYHRQVNQGPSAARNLGVRESDADVILFTDDDCCPDQGWIRGLVSPRWEEGVGIVVGRIASEGGGNWIERYCHHTGYNVFPKGAGQIRNIHNANTANCAYLRRPFLEIDGFDQVFSKVGYEDVDLTWRFILMGYRIGYRAEALVWHYHRETLKGLARAFWKRGRAGTLLRVLWRQRLDMSWWASYREVKDLLRIILRGLLLPIRALADCEDDRPYSLAWRFACLEWISDLSRRWGGVHMTTSILMGRQSLERESAMPAYSGGLKRALKAARKRLREAMKARMSEEEECALLDG